MSTRQRRRLRAPAFTAAAGLVLAVAVGVAVRWAAAAPVAAIAAAAAVVYYWVGGTDTEIGAMVGARADERQTSVRLRARALAGGVMLVVGAVGGVVAAALHDPVWPYAAIVGLGVACFLAGLAWYGRRGRLDDGGFGPGPGSRLDERQAAVVLHALQLAGVAMFVAAAVAGAALGGEPGDDALRILALVFAGVLLVRLVLFRPRSDTP